MSDSIKEFKPNGVLLGNGEYVIQHTAAGEQAQILFSQPEPGEFDHLIVGDTIDWGNTRDADIQRLKFQIGFANSAGIDALETQLRILRETHFPESINTEDWKTVPIEPTMKMIEAGAGSKYEKRARNVWRDMLASAPCKGSR